MELKRFVLLNNNKIHDLKNEKDVKAYETVKNSSHADFQVKKTSDNILDLLDVEDLVGYRFWGEDYEHIEKMTSEKRRIEKIAYNECWYQILAIYKRQSNGDYKRYEVLK